ncbi:MAG: DUF6134 family protein [bacterium]
MSSICTGLIVAIGLFLSTSVGAVYKGDLHFKIYRDGNHVGHDKVTITQDNDRTIVRRDIKITIEYAYVTVYEYTHHDREIWKNGSLQSLQATTSDNGTHYKVTAKPEENRLSVSSADTSYQAPSGIIPTSYWNRKLVQQNQLLDTQHGGLLNVQITPGPKQTVQVGGDTVQAKKYTVEGELNLKIWYDKNDRWCKTTFQKSGSTFVYRLQNSALKKND